MRSQPFLLKLSSVTTILVVLASVAPITFADLWWGSTKSPATGLVTGAPDFPEEPFPTGNEQTNFPTPPQGYGPPNDGPQSQPGFNQGPGYGPRTGGYDQGPPSFDERQFEGMFGLQLPKGDEDRISFSDFVEGGEDEAINAAVRENVARAIFSDIDEDVLAGYAAKCLENKEGEIVEDILSRIGNDADFSKACKNAERMVGRAEEAASFCEELPKLFERFGPQEGEFKLTCPPSKESITQLCETKVKEQVEREKTRFEREAKQRCEQQAQMGKRNCEWQNQQEKQRQEWEKQQWENQQQNWNNPPHPPYPGDGGNNNYQPPPDAGNGGGDPNAGSGGGDPGSGTGGEGGNGGSPATGGVTYGDPSLGGDPYGPSQGGYPQPYPPYPGPQGNYPAPYPGQPGPYPSESQGPSAIDPRLGGKNYGPTQGYPGSGEPEGYGPQPGPGGFGGGPGFGGPGFGGPGVDFMDYCEQGTFNESGFVSACVGSESEHNPISQMEEQSATMCEVQSRFMIQEFEDVCEQMEEGKNNCSDNAEKALKFAEKQLSRCKSQISKDKIRDHVTKRVEHICKIDRIKEKRKQMAQLAEAKELEAIDEIARLSEYFTDETGDAVTGTVTEKLVTVAEITQQTEEKDDREKKDFVYGIGKFLGLNAENEKDKALKLREQAEELRKSTQLLEKAGSGIQDTSAQNNLREQVDELESRAEELERAAVEIERTGGAFGGQV